MHTGGIVGLISHGLGNMGLKGIKSRLRQFTLGGADQVQALGRGLELGLPGAAQLAAATTDLAPGGLNVFWHLEWRTGPAKLGPGGRDFSGIQRAMGFRVAFEIGRALADLSLGGDQAGPVLLDRPGHGAAQGAHVVTIHGLDRPASRLEARHLVADLSHADLTVNGGVIIVPDHGQLGEFQAGGQRNGLMADPLHQTAVSGHDPGAVVDQVLAIARRHRAFGHGHANGRR